MSKDIPVTYQQAHMEKIVIRVTKIICITLSGIAAMICITLLNI